MGYHSENKRSLEFTFLWVWACVLEHRSVVNMLDVELLQVRKAKSMCHIPKAADYNMIEFRFKYRSV